MNNCNDGFGTPENCHELTVLSDEEINKCALPSLVDEKVEGECALNHLCSNVEIH